MGVKQRAIGGRALEVVADFEVRCWCGGVHFEPLNLEYGICTDCGAVTYRQAIEPSGPDDADDSFYDDRYWRHHVPRVLGLPGLEERARSDLAERAVFQLVKILEYQAPQGRLLELGCGAGSLTYLLRQAGFDAEGLELGPTAIQLARERFGLTMHRGPLESMGDSDPWDTIVAIDVLEHLQDPLATLTLCADRLATGGRLFLQTPCYRQDGADWPMLLPREHLFLFTEDSIERLLREAGFTEVKVGRSLFPHDMWVTASMTSPLVDREDPLAGVPPLVVALVDAYAESNRAHGEREAIDADRDLKQRDVDRLQGELESLRADQAAKADLLRQQDKELDAIRVDQAEKERLIDRLSSELETTQADQRAQQDLIESLDTELTTVRGDQQAKNQLIERLDAELETMRQDRAERGRMIDRLGLELEVTRADQLAKGELIQRLNTELEEVRGDQLAKDELIQRLSPELEEVRADQLVKEELIGQLSSELETVRADQLAKEAVIGRLRQKLESTSTELESIRSDRRYRLLERAGIRLGGRR